MDRIGRYKIVRELGRGAMGVVYHAIDPNIGRAVAIKTIQLVPTRKPEEMERMKERLFREARSAGSLSHPGIVTIYDVDQQDDLAYIAMEYVDGQTLEQILEAPDPLPADRMFSILSQTAVALDYAHSKKIVHRDIKPANIMVTADGASKITDFGIAKLTTSEQLTRTGSIVGTPHYMSPEQVQGQAVDGRSDQFSLAVIAYELLTGEKPYAGEHLTTVVYKIVAEEPAPPRRLNPSLTPAIEAVLRKGLAKRPDGRYQNCQEFVSSLEAACTQSKGWKVMPRSGLLGEPTLADAAPLTKPALPPPRRTRRSASATSATTADAKRKSGFLTFLLAMLVVAGLLALIGWQAMPWLMPQGEQRQPVAQSQEPHPTDPASTPQEFAPQPQTPPPETPSSPPAETIPPPNPTGDSKPSPMTPAEPAPEKEPQKKAATKTVLKVSPAPPQDVSVISSPAGATARLDNNPAISCTTPCNLSAMPGKHTVTIIMPGYLAEARDIIVGNGPLEMAPVSMRTTAGTLMLTSSPEGATITINGKKQQQLTPANLSLTPGTYTITVEKDGRQSSGNVTVREGITTYRKILLDQ